MPDASSDNIKVTHGVDAATRTAWLQMAIAVPLTQPATVFSMAGVTLRLLNANFTGLSKISVTPGQPPRRQVKGSITGTWDIQIGGMELAQLVDCTLHFEEGAGIGFDVTPEKIKLQSALSFLSDLLSELSPGGGFSCAFTPA